MGHPQPWENGQTDPKDGPPALRPPPEPGKEGFLGPLAFGTTFPGCSFLGTCSNSPKACANLPNSGDLGGVFILIKY